MELQEVKKRVKNRLNIFDFKKLEKQLLKNGMEENSFLEPLSPFIYQKPSRFMIRKKCDFVTALSIGITSTSRYARR